MRRVRFSAAISLDGFITGPEGEIDWIVMDPELDFQALFASFDTVLMGRKSYQEVRRMGEEAMPRMEVHVFSRTLRQEDCPGVRVSPDPAAAVDALRRRPGKDLWLFGGGELFRSFLDLGLVDSVEVAVIPVLLGSGRPFLPPPARRMSLRLRRHRVYRTTGTVLLEYDVLPAPGSPAAGPSAGRSG